MEKIKLGIIGLGRMGLVHAKTASLDPRVELKAICVLNDKYGLEGINNLKKEMGHDNFEIYHDFEEMLDNANLDGVLVISSTALHPLHIKQAMERNIHVFSEKPLAIKPADAVQLKKDVAQYLDNTLLRIGYMRRYDQAYRQAKKLIDQGKIGKPFLVRSYGQDMKNKIEGVLKFGPSSGGEFVDMSAHDINLARWYLGTEPSEIWAIGDCYEFDQFKEWNDADNATALIKMTPDKDGKQAMVFILAGRTANHGYNVETEIMGTNGTLRIGSTPRKNLLEILDDTGVVVECSLDFPERFEQAYRDEIISFIDEINQVKNNMYDWNKKPIVSIDDGIHDLISCYKAKESFETKQLIKIDWKHELS